MRNVFICDYVRTPIGRYGGALSGVRADDLAALPLKALIARNTSLDAAAIGEVILGCANQAGEDNRNLARMALLIAGYPVSVPAITVNRLCGSGLSAVAMGAAMITRGEAGVVVAGGAESMSRAPFVMAKATRPFDRAAKLEDTTIGWRFVNPVIEALYGVESMGETAENLADAHAISRADQDAYALRSQQRADAAKARRADEIIAVSAPRGRETVPVSEDEHPRADTSAQSLAQLKPAFRAGGSVTAGNAAGVNDGAAALILASEAAAKTHGLIPIARVGRFAAAGVEPRIMGAGPIPAVEKLLEAEAASLAAFDRIEINEAFAAQVLTVTRALGLADDAAHVNPDGGAIALGHPLGMSGARLAGTAGLALSRGEAKAALVSMCVGVGQGVALSLYAV
ncbi:MAG: acetyl-CoA C-acyltransferase [Oceanicaulis sp.]